MRAGKGETRKHTPSKHKYKRRIAEVQRNVYPLNSQLIQM